MGKINNKSLKIKRAKHKMFSSFYLYCFTYKVKYEKYSLFCLFSICDRTSLTYNRNLDLSWISHLVLNLCCDFVRKSL